MFLLGSCNLPLFLVATVLVDTSEPPTPSDNWITQWKAMFVGYPDIQFYKVNEKGAEGGDNVNRTIQNWHGCKNIKYIDYQTMLDIIEKK